MGSWASRLLEATSIIKPNKSHAINMSELQGLMTILKQKKGKRLNYLKYSEKREAKCKLYIKCNFY